MRAVVAALLISLAVIVLAGPCPNNCSNHGSCGGNPATCSCNQGWAGDDCSEQIVALSANKAVSGYVGTRMWNFYSYMVTSSGSSLTWSVNQTSTGDCDLYLKAGSIPTRYDYDMRDIGTGSTMTLIVASSKSTIYYAGIYGYTGCNYQAGVYLPGGGSNNCPNGCSGHGSCNSQGLCNCQAGWSGVDCSTSLNMLTPSRPVSATVQATQWNYYYFNISTTTSVATVVVNQTSASTDCDIYIKNGALPSRFDYDFSDKTSDQNFAVVITEPALGTWYAGVTGFTDCSYTVTLYTNTQSCPAGACSNHGSCKPNSAACVCQPGYNGNNCENMLAPLSDGQVQYYCLNTAVATGYAASSASWNYYHYLAFAADNIIVTLNRLSTPGACALYARAGSNPTTNRYDNMIADSASTMTLTIPDPGQSIWYLGVVGFSQPCNYSISVTDTDQCPNSCSGHGQCYDGTCLCNANWASDDCSVQQVTLTVGGVVSGSVTSGSWAYYVLTVPGGVSVTSVTVAVRELTTTGLVWVFVSEQQTATLRQYDHADTSETNHHVIHFERDPANPGQATVYSIGVYGSPFTTGNGSTRFTLTAWYPSI